jgi:anaerobic magnesium-protoporphyrin IX monomethyl ester cyclase
VPAWEESLVTDVLLIGAEELENLSTRYLAAVLRQHGISVELCPFSTVDELGAAVQQAMRMRPRLVGLSIIFQYRAPEFLALADALSRSLHGVHITAGGHFPSFAADELLRDAPALNSIVRGEGEETLLELMEHLDDRGYWPAIQGLSFRSGGEIRHNPPRPLIRDLDALPFPVRDASPQQCLGVGLAPILGSRGCCRNCSFCSVRAFYGTSPGKIQRFRTVPNLVAEMEEIYHTYGVRFFIFNDDEWFPPGSARLARVTAFEREIHRRGLDVIMGIKCRADDVDEDLFRRLHDMGVVRVYVGVESASDHALQTLNKQTTAAQNARAIEILQRIGMLTDFGLIFFDPESTVEDIRANLDFMRRMGGAGQAPLSFGRLEVFAGTPILERLGRAGRLAGNYLAWNYTITDPRVEMLFRFMIVALKRRQYAPDGLTRHACVACYQETLYRYRMGARADAALCGQLHAIIARANNHTLDLLEEMFEFACHENIYDVPLVNGQVGAWASRTNFFDMEIQAELSAWQARMEASAAVLL